MKKVLVIKIKVLVKSSKLFLFHNPLISEFWIGLEHLSKYTNCDCYWELNVTLTDFEGETYTGHYSRFYIDKGKTHIGQGTKLEGLT